MPLVARRAQGPQSPGVKLAGVLASFSLLVAATPCAAQAADGAHPLLDFARERERERDVESHSRYYAMQLTQARHELDRARPPTDEECARSIGAKQFATLYVDLAEAHEGLGNTEEALQAYRHALACRPRSLRIHTLIAKVLFAARQFDAAGAAAGEALAIDPREVESNRLAGNLDFVDERWADALARFRYVASSDPDPESAAFAQLMFWVSQRRAGVAKPEWIPRRLDEEWPRPLVLFVKGEYDEADLVRFIRKSGDEHWAGGALDRQLASSLFFVGETLWSRGEPELARRYFAAVVNVGLADTDEYRLAMSEIAKLNLR